MKQSTERASTATPHSDSRHDSQRSQLLQPQSGRLTQMSALINGCPRMHSLTEMAGWMNQGASAGNQPTQLEVSPMHEADRVELPNDPRPINNDASLEHETGVMAANALQPARSAQASVCSMPAQRAVVQREGGGLLAPLIPGGAERYMLAEPEHQEEEAGRARDLQQWNTELQAQQQQHLLNQQAVYTVVNAPADLMNLVQVPDLGLPVEAILANTKEYISRNLALIAMTPTLSTRLKPPRAFERVWPPVPDEAYKGELFFDNSSIYPATGSNRKAAEGLSKTDAGVIVRTSNETAHAQGINIRIFMDRPLDPEELKGTLIHEIQHVLDSHGEVFRESVINDINGKYGDVANAYRSEFRAYWLEDADGTRFGDPAQPALNARPVVEKWWIFNNWRSEPTAFANRRQERIFWHLATCGTYPWVKPNYLHSAAFRAVVNGLATPTGGNLINSLRIRGFSTTLDLAGPGFAFYVDDLIQEAQEFDMFDLVYLHSPQAAPFWTFFDGKFNGPFNDNEHRDRVALIKAHLEEIIHRP
jgi:hypothetical protein